MMTTDEAVSLLLDELDRGPAVTRAGLLQLKRRVAARTGQPLIRNDAALTRYRDDVRRGVRRYDRGLEQALVLNRVRSISGIATVTVITEPYACPGRCVYCPTEARAPKSYLTNEPAVMRAVRNDYDPFRQVTSRLKALDQTGHPTDKIELIVKGGTWSFYPDEYQRWFIRRCVEAANGFERSEGGGERADEQTLEVAQRRNETAAHRLIGLTIETRPDYVDEAQLRRLRELGVTRVELGVQTLNERILSLIVRDHTTREIRLATGLLRDAGFKVAYHLMPNLPGACPADDLRTCERIFEEPAYRPDTLKIYPCVVIETAELYRWWREGRYHAYDDETLVELLVEMKSRVPPYVRLERIIRDIPSTSILAGCKLTNLREAAVARMRSRGLRCRCIRCREIREQPSGDCRLVRRDYEAAGGVEVFLSYEDPHADRLAALLRLRIPGSETRPWSPALVGAALVRELHTYGQQLTLGDHAEAAAQHRGFGRGLMAQAERIAGGEFGLRRMAVIAGVGVREYYRRLGYRLEDTYMVKTLA
ncbi:MAG: tRNA uridine(34) 5-carboxymethylaminomethyl modification radical SAM/GNAT enzyme Elp3 [Candidatus Omnitrophica bacterium]|nr:tRNA uridine(34) 5-carboxymethylaminomethyl modification radical SAM/GNAT enzyme Elp3 [Candidatus Omnitrophota bacterium]